ncbi:hypothetical protein GCM10011369_00270 [Neiella marina]|uniref:Uncharacterized protein n=1 Tax=Neiella marina TaxID=508461 RepID=A0A8J2U1H2_9GAMM|nr:hypothetical protein [Neiella marina]GGA62939.1 hypothetical protein GCM10011369_00270 [Neiella marina]
MTTEFNAADLLEVAENQIADGEPLLVKETLMRLMMTGHSREQALELICCALSVEFTAIVEHNGSFDLARYSNSLKQLPEVPWLEE